MKLDTLAIRRLRDHLLGLARVSIGPQHGASRVVEASPEEAIVMDRFRPYAEMFYLVAISDGAVDSPERAVMTGAFRALTGGRVRTTALHRLLDELAVALKEDGVESRLEAVCSALALDKEDAELAFTLAMAVALANRKIESSEANLIEKLRSWLGISTGRASLLTHSL